MKVQPGYTFKGVTYLPDHDYEDDNMKIFHIVEVNNKEVSMDWSPYSTPSVEEFQTWVNLGMPKRVTNGPLNREDLVKLLQEKNNG
jgi:hypothetical protein